MEMDFKAVEIIVTFVRGCHIYGVRMSFLTISWVEMK